MKKKNIKVDSWWYLVVGLIVGYFFFVHLFDFSGVSTIKHDLVSWALPGQAINKGFGVLYRDYWNVNPPGVILFTHLWMTIFGVSGLSFQFLHFILVLSCLVGMICLFKKVFSPFLSAWLSVVTSIVFLSPQILTMLAASELNGLALSLLAVNLLITSPKKPLIQLRFAQKAGLATFLFVLSGQMKDPFIFTIFALVPFLGFILLKYRKMFVRTIKGVFVGGMSGLLLIFGYLTIYQSLIPYFQVFMAKRDMFLMGGPVVIFLNFNRALKTLGINIIHLPYSIPLLIGLSFVFYLFLKILIKEFVFNKKTDKKNNHLRLSFDLEVNRENLNYLTLLFYSIGSLFGYSLQTRYGNHYDIQTVFPLIILISIPLLIVFRVGNKWLKNKFTSRQTKYLYLFITSSLLILLTLPKIEYLAKYSYKQATIPNFWSNTQKVKRTKEYEFKEKIDSLIGPDECIMNLYGWAVGINYFYLERQPCTRFFIPNILPSKYNQEYGDDLVENPPGLILYRKGGADLDVTVFENTVFNYTKVLSECYKLNETDDWIFLPKTDTEELRQCIKENR